MSEEKNRQSPRDPANHGRAARLHSRRGRGHASALPGEHLHARARGHRFLPVRMGGRWLIPKKQFHAWLDAVQGEVA